MILPLLTVLVCAKDDRRVRRLLESLDRQTASPSEFCAVVVSTGQDDYLDLLGRFGFEVTLVRAAGQRLPIARNLGLARVRTEFVLTTDADCVAAADLVEQTMKSFGRAPAEVAGIGGAIEKYSTATAVQRHGITINAGQRGLQYLPASPWPYITGAHAAFRAGALREVGGYDERFSCGEDVDVCYRLAAAGWRLEVNSAAVVKHEDRTSVYAHFRRFRWYAVDQALLFKLYRGGSARRVHINRYPWRRAAYACRVFGEGLPSMLRGDISGAQEALVTLAEVCGVLAGDLEGSIRHGVVYF